MHLSRLPGLGWALPAVDVPRYYSIPCYSEKAFSARLSQCAAQHLTNTPFSVIVCRRFLRLHHFYPARGDDTIMSTKTKVTKESAPKATSPVTAPAKSGVAKAEKSASKAKTHPVTNTPKPQQEVVSTPAEKPVVKADPKEKAAVEQAVPRTPPVAAPDQKWQEIRLILEKLKEDTIREIRKSVKIGSEAVAAIEPGGDIYDQASSERDRELGLLLGDREREKIHSIDEALLRIDEGDYGICEECDEDIPLGRLRAMPFTRHCVKCKSDLEKLQAQTKRVEEERAYREIPLGSEEDES